MKGQCLDLFFVYISDITTNIDVSHRLYTDNYVLCYKRGEIEDNLIYRKDWLLSLEQAATHILGQWNDLTHCFRFWTSVCHYFSKLLLRYSWRAAEPVEKSFGSFFKVLSGEENASKEGFASPNRSKTFQPDWSRKVMRGRYSVKSSPKWKKKLFRASFTLHSPVIASNVVASTTLPTFWHRGIPLPWKWASLKTACSCSYS